MSKEPATLKQKKGSENGRNKYLKPGALAQLRYSRTATRSCKVVGRKRVTSDSEKKVGLPKAEAAVLSTASPAVSPTPTRTDFQFTAGAGDGTRPLGTPKTPQAERCDSQSRLESLPLELLVKILCHLHHDQLRASFHVSQRVRTAVILAREWHFNYTTPDRSRLEVLRTKTPLPTEYWPFVSRGDGRGVRVSRPHTPKAPRHGPRPSRLHPIDMKQIAAVLFREPAYPSRCAVPPRLPRAVLRPLASNRVLFYEDELCQAVSQNKLR